MVNEMWKQQVLLREKKEFEALKRILYQEEKHAS